MSSMIYTNEQKKTYVLDVCCGSKMFWFNKINPLVVYNDIRSESHTLCDGRHLEVSPETTHDFTNLPFSDGRFRVVVFDPPHLNKLGKNSWMAKKYGVLNQSWQRDIQLGFKECFRVLGEHGVLIFKWNETQIKVSEILKLSDNPPLIGHISGKRANTHWITFLKPIKEGAA